MLPGMEWLTARPIAHRGLHDVSAGIIENSMSAVEAAIDQGYTIEVDIQRTADDRAVVFHDFGLARLTDETGALLLRDLSSVEKIKFNQSSDTIASLDTLLEIVDGKVPLVIEIKSAEDGNTVLASCLAKCAMNYKGQIAAQSFDPRMLDALRAEMPFLPRGLISYNYRDGHAALLTPRQRLRRRHLVAAYNASPHFIAYGNKSLPALAPKFARSILGMPILSWTVRSQKEHDRLKPYVDQIIFEGFRPE